MSLRVVRTLIGPPPGWRPTDGADAPSAQSIARPPRTFGMTLAVALALAPRAAPPAQAAPSAGSQAKIGRAHV